MCGKARYDIEVSVFGMSQNTRILEITARRITRHENPSHIVVELQDFQPAEHESPRWAWQSIQGLFARFRTGILSRVHITWVEKSGERYPVTGADQVNAILFLKYMW